jgi:serine/threonine-protein kinase PpkA
LGFLYVAVDRRAGRKVAIKELIPVLAADPYVQRRFVREGRTMQRLQHPHIAHVTSILHDKGNVYMIVEYLSGGSLAERLDRARFTLAQATTMIMSLGGALAYLHSKGIVHCDVNPSNVLLDERGVPKLSDLGIAHVSDSFVHRSWRTERGFTMGTVTYMAPEQVRGVRDDPRIDQYALAALFYRMVAGRTYLSFDPAHTLNAQAENARRIEHQAPAPIPELPHAVNRVILRALSKSASDRYPDIETFVQTLSKAVAPHLPAAQGLRLIAPFEPAPRQEAAAHESWGNWIWPVLLTLNVAVMAAFAWLLFCG